MENRMATAEPNAIYWAAFSKSSVCQNRDRTSHTHGNLHSETWQRGGGSRGHEGRRPRADPRRRQEAAIRIAPRQKRGRKTVDYRDQSVPPRAGDGASRRAGVTGWPDSGGEPVAHTG